MVNKHQTGLVIFGGVAGAGKDTQARLLSERCGWPILVVSEALRATQDPKVLSYIKLGKLVPKDVLQRAVSQMLDKILQSAPSCIIMNGILRSMDNVEVLERLLGKYHLKLEAVFWLKLEKSTVIRRLQNRYICPKCKRIYNLETSPPKNDLICDVDGTPLIKREDDSDLERILRRVKVIESNYPRIKAALARYGRWYDIDANRPVEKIHNEIVGLLHCDKIRVEHSN